MEIDEEFESLCLPKASKSLAWEARAKITWGDQGDQVQAWLVAHGIDQFAAERIVAICVRERAREIRVKGTRDLVLGILVGVGGIAVWIGAVMVVKLGLFAVPVKGIALVGAFALTAFMYGVHLTWRGLARIIGGSRFQGAVSDVGD